MLLNTFKTVCTTLLAGTSIYLTLLGLLATVPSLQAHVFYLHRVTLTWFKNLEVPEQFGFAPAQVHSFYIETKQDVCLHTWHILPLGIYRRHRNSSITNASVGDDKSSTLSSLDILKSDPNARLVVYFHGTAGCLASGWRPDSYRAISAAAPDHIHVLAFDYRGYGLSSGTPSEEGLLADGIAVIQWALEVAQIEPERIVIYGQSLGTAVALALMEHYAAQPEPVLFSGHVLTASFSDVATLTATYRIGGVIPVLSPLRRMPALLSFFTSFLRSTWLSKDRIAAFVRLRESATDKSDYYINLIHAQDDSDIAYEHSNVLYWHAVNASTLRDMTYDEVQEQKMAVKKDLGHGGWVAEHRTSRGLIRQTMLAYGVHDKLMSYAVTSLAVLEAFQASDPGFLT